MSRAEEADGHVFELVRSGLLARPELTRALAGDVAERAPERAQAAPARLEGDLRDGQVGVAEQRRGPLDSPREQVPVRRDAEGLLEGPREVGLGDAAHARQPPDGPLLVRGGVHAVLRAQQAPQQLGVLAHASSTVFLRTPVRAGLAVDVAERELAARDLEHAEHDRQMEAPRSDRAGVEHGQAAVAADERHVRVAAHDQACAAAVGEPRGVGADPRPVHRDVHQQQLQRRLAAGADVDGDRIRQLVDALVDVAAHRDHGRDLGQLVEHAQIADVARVQDRRGRERAQMLGRCAGAAGCACRRRPRGAAHR